jgi:hypothetical protein
MHQRIDDCLEKADQNPLAWKVGNFLADLTRQFRPAFCATPFQHQTSGTGRHTSPKSVGAFSLYAAWLICTFHVVRKI